MSYTCDFFLLLFFFFLILLFFSVLTQVLSCESASTPISEHRDTLQLRSVCMTMPASHAHPIYRQRYLLLKKKMSVIFQLCSCFCEKKIEKNVNCYLKGSFKCVPRAEGVRFLTDYLHVLTSVRALLTGMVKMHRWRSHWNVQDFCGYASNVVYVFFVCLFFIIYHPWSSSWMTFHIKLLSVSRVCFVVTVCVCVSSNRTKHATVGYPVRVCVCVCVCLCVCVLSLNWCESGGPVRECDHSYKCSSKWLNSNFMHTFLCVFGIFSAAQQTFGLSIFFFF